MAAPPKLTVEAFLGVVRQSGLIDAELLKKTWKELKERGVSLDDPQPIGDEFVARNLLTRWQLEKLLHGKHKGFFLGKYRLLSYLGSGGMSAVYLAEHVLMRRRVAIKVLPTSRKDDSSYLERFHREAQAVAALDHRNIVRAYDVDQEDERHFLVMEYVPGQSLHELVVKNGPVDFVAAAEYMRQAAEGLQHAHRMGMVHRDIKPGNLLLDEKGTVKLLDLGLARFFEEKDEHSLTVKHDEKVLGTADYLSPEQALDSHKVDIRSDIYSLGCTLYFLLTGRPPFPEGTLAQRLMAHQTKPPRPIQESRPDIHPGLQAILERMMAKKPEDRFQTAKETAQELFSWLSDNGGSAWMQMNPPVSGSSQVLGGVPGSSSNVLSPDQVRSPVTGDPLLGTVAGAAATTGGHAHPGGSSFSVGAPVGAEAAAGDPQLAAFFSHLADEGSTRISRSPPGQTQPMAPAADTTPQATPLGPAFEATITSPQMEFPGESFASPAAPDVTWPSADRISFEASQADAPTEFAKTLSMQQSEGDDFQQLAATIMVPEERSAPPVAPRVAAPIAAPLPPVARPVVAAPVARPVVPRQKPPRISRNVMIGAGSAAVLLLAVVSYFLFIRSPASKTADADKTKDSAGTGKKKKKSGREEKVLSAQGEFTVGPAGQYRTIGAALADIKMYKTNPSKKSIQTIKVAGGQTYNERIVIDETLPRGIQIVADAASPAVLSSPGSDPTVVVRAAKGTIDHFHLEGFQIDATGKDVAVELSEWVVGAQLKRLEIHGFAKAGVHLNGAETYSAQNDRIVVENVTFRNAAPGAAGVLLTRRTEDPLYVRINQCRMLGPLDAGVRIDTNAIGIEITESIFFENSTGILLQGEDRMWKDILIASNTFYQSDRAIVFAAMPGAQTGDLAFHNNLFVNSKAADVIVEKNYKSADFFLMYRTNPGGSAFNWTTRTPGDPPAPGELATLFETHGKKSGVADLQFASTDPTSPDFLAPVPGSPQRQVGTLLDPKKFGQQVGAVRPR
jgi:serine/threonine-protein kinase